MKETEAGDINGLISSESLERVNEERLLQAELLHRSHQIRHFDRVKYDLARDGEDHTAAFERLSTAREELLGRLRKRRESSDYEAGAGDEEEASLPPRLDLVAPRLGHAGEGRFVFGTEGCVAVPRASNGVSVTPGAGGTFGEILTTARSSQGKIFFDSEVGKGPGVGSEHVWLRNWRYVVLFPCTTTRSFFTYKFQVHIQANLFSEATGFLMSFVSIGEEPEASPTSNIEVDTDAGWPLVADLSEPRDFYNGHYGFMRGEVTVERTFTVNADRTPAVAIVVGVVVRLTTGSVRLSFPSLGDSTLWIDNGEDSEQIGQVCYRYVPILVADPT